MKFYLRELNLTKEQLLDPETVTADSPEEALTTINSWFLSSWDGRFSAYEYLSSQFYPEETLKNLVDMGVNGLPSRAPNAAVYLVTATGYKTKYILYQIS